MINFVITLINPRISLVIIACNIRVNNVAKQKIDRPLREPDHVSKRGVPYWWSPEWVRATSASESSFGKIRAILDKECVNSSGIPTHKTCKCPKTVNLYMTSKMGKLTYIQGSIQKEFKDWHDDRQIDYILLGETPEAASELIVSETEDTKYE